MTDLKQQLEAVRDRMAEEHFKKTGWAPTEGYVLNYQAGFNAAIPIILKAVEQMDGYAAEVIESYNPRHQAGAWQGLNDELLKQFVDGGK